MWNNLTKTLLGQDVQNVIIKEDPNWGFAEFPAPGDTKKHLLPILIDPEETNSKQNPEGEEKTSGKQMKQFWMPDKFCKVCYACEEPFTMYRRRHHCRMCGQVFCNNCSNYSIDGALFNAPGLVRACQVCYEQANEKASNEIKLAKRRPVEKSIVEIQNAQIRELNAEYKNSNNNLQERASSHLSAIVDRLIDTSKVISADQTVWKETVVNLVKVVVSSVDPDVRSGDNLDIRPYVKIKVIPGGTMSECVYVDGVVFRKNVSHKKMAVDGTKTDPRILLLAGGIEFQRTEAKLSSMDTLIEQEDKFMEILVEKIMSLKPDIILVGKAVARKAQELLCEHKVLVMQNVKQTILERVARMSGAMLLPSTDSMIKQFGEECLGTCGKFWLRLVQDDPERSNETQAARILRTRISRASTYAYIEGCPSERGCTIVLRGGDRSLLAEVKRIIRFSILVAYHLRLEVAYYNDRFADLPIDLDDALYDDSSDIDDEIVDGEFESKEYEETNPTLVAFMEQFPEAKSRKERYFISTSMDIDFNIPYRKELLGTSLFRSKNLTKFNIESHQSLLITSLLMLETPNSAPLQKTPADVKGIKYYTKHDVALGAFIIENCFQFTRSSIQRESRMLDQTLSFAHKSGRIDISVKKLDGKTAASVIISEDSLSSLASNNGRDPLHLPMYISSFCRECGKNVTPQHILSEEVWKMSFGKFLELMFYNRSAKCTIGGCNHSLRDSHVLSFTCESYVATFEFYPIHPFALNVRESMVFPEDFYWKQTLIILNQLPEKHSLLMEDFRLAINVLEREVQDILSSRPEDLALAMADVQLMSKELNLIATRFYEELLRTYESLPKRYSDKETENRIRSILNDRVNKIAKTERPLSIAFTAEAIAQFASSPPPVGLDVVPTADRDHSSVLTDATEINNEHEKGPLDEATLVEGGGEEGYPTEYNASVAALFPMIHFRDTFLKACRWNTRIDTIYKFLESVRNMLLQQLQAKEQSISEKVNTGGHGVTAIVSQMYATAEAEELDSDYQSHKKHLTDVVIADLGRNPLNTVDLPAAVAATLASQEGTKQLPPPPLEEATAVATAIRETRTSVSDSISISNAVPAESITIAHATTSSGGMNTLYRAALEQNRRTSDRPVDKMSRITKTLQRFLVGNKDSLEEQNRFFVPLGEFGIGRYGLKPGRNGVVVPVSEEVLASIIAYTLASNQYYEDLQASIREDTIERHHDLDQMHDMDTNTGTNNAISEEEKQILENDFPEHRPGKAKTLQGQQFNSSSNDDNNASNSSATTASSSDIFSLGQTIIGPFKRRDTGGPLHRNDNSSNNLPVVQEGDNEEEEEEDLENTPRSVHKYSHNKGLHSLMKNLHDELLSSQHDHSGISGFGSTNNLFNSSSSNAMSTGFDGGALLQTNDLTSPNDHSLSPTPRSAATAVINNVTANIQEGVKKLFVSDGGTPVGNESNSDRKVTENFAASGGIGGHSAAGGASAVGGSNNSPHTPNQQQQSSQFYNSPAPSSYFSHSGTDSTINNTISPNEKQMISQDKSSIRHRFDDYDDRGTLLCKFQCQVYFAKQFEAVRNCYFGEEDNRENYIRSLAMSAKWSAQGGKSGASFSKTMDERLICKQISRVELQMFLDFAPAYFEYMAKAYYHNLPTVLCKILGVYTVRYDNKETGKKATENIVVMENIFYDRNITTTFDLKGSSRARYAELLGDKKDYFDDAVFKRRRARRKMHERARWAADLSPNNNNTTSSSPNPTASADSFSSVHPRESNSTPRLTNQHSSFNGEDWSEQDFQTALQPTQRISQVLLDDNLMEFTRGRPFPLKHRAKLFFHKAVQNDTLFLSIVNVVDYSILVGFDENRHEMVVGIIDFLRQYDIIKKMERVGKGSVGMLTGQAEPTIIQPSQYRKRFTLAMERYFMTIPDKWISYDT